MYLFYVSQSVQANFTMDRSGRQADEYIAPGVMFFYVFVCLSFCLYEPGNGTYGP